MKLRLFRRLAVALALGLCAASIPARAALITQTIDFHFDGFYNDKGILPPYDFVQGSVTVTYDIATPVSIFDLPVDSISIASPTGTFDLSDVRFSLLLGNDIYPDVRRTERVFGVDYESGPSYEIGISAGGFGTRYDDTSDFHIRILGPGHAVPQLIGFEPDENGILQPVFTDHFAWAPVADFEIFSGSAEFGGADPALTDYPMSASFIGLSAETEWYSNGGGPSVGGDGVGFYASSTFVPAAEGPAPEPSVVPEPATALLLGAGLVVLGLRRRK